MRFRTLYKHATQNRRNPYVRMEGVRNRVLDLDVCPKCSNLTLGDTRKDDPVRRYRTCPVCGWHGPGGKTLRDLLKEDGIMKGGELHLR